MMQDDTWDEFHWDKGSNNTDFIALPEDDEEKEIELIVDLQQDQTKAKRSKSLDQGTPIDVKQQVTKQV
jgi:hypothetical protein